MEPYIAGSEDTRAYVVEGCSLSVSRGPGRWEVSFHGQGRDGDFVPPGAPEPEVLLRVLQGVKGLESSGPTSLRAPDAATLDEVERRLAAASPWPPTITRIVRGDDQAAARILRAPRPAGTRRHISVRAHFEVVVELPVSGEGTVCIRTWGKVPPDFAETTLRRLGLEPVPVGTRGEPRFVVSAAALPIVLAAARAELGAEHVGVTDSRV